MSLTERKRAAAETLRRAGKLAVAFSGGVDSSLVLALAVEALGRENVLAVTADSALLPRRERDASVALAASLGVEHVLVPTREMGLPRFVQNPPNRCFFCKREHLARLGEEAARRGFSALAHGVNRDDFSDHRPGLAAAEEARALAPLAEAGLTKEQVRALAKDMGLPVWNKPSAACLASRIPHGEPVTAEKLARIEAAEDYLLSLGLAQVRVRCRGTVAVIEAEPGEIGRLAEEGLREKIAATLKALGFSHVALDLEGYRTGSLNP
ncbi:MAG: ATP-dependent sacrificial sulfur transferase LarE [Deltaproteobacteria bacterium]|nr:ATP-dependent sacrificial sulfur transferase LarE [Deltaproteobacteria bacterium]